ncbi:MAG: YaeQ family protein [Lautropia sp.]|nr:YaeQ family protein [Lautropia sp.]
MALKSTVFKLGLNVSDMDRPYYGEHALTVARHPSENDERMMVRVLAFALHADEDLRFGRGLSTEDEADLYAMTPDGRIRLWIDVGQPDERLIRKAAAKAEHVVVLAYGRTAPIWWEKVQADLARLDNLTVWRLDAEDSRALGALAQRGASLQCIVQDGQLWFGDEGNMLEPVCHRLKAAAGFGR